MADPASEPEIDYFDLLDDDLDGSVSDREKFGVADKIRECRYFFEKMQATTDWSEFRWLTSAFVSALRSVTFCLAYNVENALDDDDGGKVRDEEAVQKLSPYIKVSYQVLWRKKKPIGGRYHATPVHPLLIRLNSHRITTVHFGPLWIKPTKVAAPSEFMFKGRRFLKEEDEPVLKFGEEVLALFKKMLGEIGEVGYDPPEEASEN